MEAAESPYSSKFYRQQEDGSYRSAQVVLGLVYEMFSPRSVIDVGCGTGAWLSVAADLGSVVLRGLDGKWVNPDSLRNPAIEFTAIDFEMPIQIDRKYDLCISLEVAEHVSESRAADFVEALCRAADVVLFSAAIRHQGGTAHVNEQWQSHWIRLFDERGYRCLDVIRPATWHNEDVEWWYRQNTFLFARRAEASSIRLSPESVVSIADVVHPRNYETKLQKLQRRQERPTLRYCVDCFSRYLAIKTSRLFGRE